MIYSFFGGEISDSGYVEGNIDYADEYITVLNDNITTNLNGYVPLSRLIYFYLEDDSLSLKSIYENNLDYELKTIKPISDVCSESYNSFFVCKESEISSSNQSDEYPYKPFNAPIKFEDATITSFFGSERIVFDEFDIHYAWDFGASAETKVYSIGEGIVKTVRFNQSKNETDKDNGAGNYIIIEYDIDEIQYDVLYGHLYPSSSKVKEGDMVNSWQEIASVGTTGYSTGNHLHWEVSVNGNKIDGMSLIDFNL